LFALQSDLLPASGSAEKEHASSLSIFFVLSVLALCIFVVHALIRFRWHAVPESLALIFLGAAVGLVLKLVSSDAATKRVEAFSPTAFFLVLLPPIIFESGYNLHKGTQFRLIGLIT
jgi:sodium/hydrogen exchanger 8